MITLPLSPSPSPPAPSLLSQVNKQQLQAVKERFLAFLNGETQIVADEAFCNAVRSYYETVGGGGKTIENSLRYEKGGRKNRNT
ncbi:hypothetical protein KUCAC02_020520 [Chaenocephalus aceratus]|nr:hypothetical protein KUCAC02_020520 [Chaenocephalus aceratus]